MAVKVRALIILATIVLVNLPTGLVVDAAIHDKQQEPARRRNVNFAFGGATTNSRNAGQFFSEEVNEQVENAGLELIGLTQQLEWAIATVNDVNHVNDVFMVFASSNSYAFERNPLVPVTELVKAMDVLYKELGARHFIVPNQLSLADLPLTVASFDAFTVALSEVLSVLHNAILAIALTGFQLAHPDATIIRVDVYSEMKKHLKNGQFFDTINDCLGKNPAGMETYYTDTNNAEDGDFGYGLGPCNGFLYLDGAHPSSVAWEPMAKQIANGLAKYKIDAKRFITFGDSFSDLGSNFDVVVRANIVPTPPFGAPQVPPFTEGRFTEGRNLVQQVELLIGAETLSSAFIQPFTASETFTVNGGISSIAGDIFVPKTLRATDSTWTQKRNLLRANDEYAMVNLTFSVSMAGQETELTKCTYGREKNKKDTASFILQECKRNDVTLPPAGGDLLPNVATVEINLLNADDSSVTIDWLYYK